ncbi:MAG TPA: hypothetical protein VHM25_13430 [Polyangiaceae bacterium]|jgi:hypothetical protein|nr:hypothetical protein [Polyangiaceae bacterium]
MGTFRASLLATVVFTLSACGGAPSEPATPPAPPATPAPEPAAPAPAGEAPKPAEPAASAEAPAAIPEHDVWKEGMTKDQQVAFMKKNVVPEMGPVFKGFDAKRYAEFSCKTCHGPKFKDPKEFLPKLTFKDGKLVSPSDEPALAKFMFEQVTPHMAAAMGLKPFDMTTHTGFGCGGCHSVQSK